MYTHHKLFFEIPQCAKHVIFIPYFPTQLYCCSFILLLCSSSKSKKMIVPTFCITVERIKHGPLSEAKQVIVMAFKLVKTFHGPSLDQVSISIRVAKVVTVHDDLLTHWRPIKMSKFCANIFLIQTTSNYLWASEVSKNQVFQSQLFLTSHPSNQWIMKLWYYF